MYRSSFRKATTTLPFALLFLGACDTPSPTAPALSPTLARRAEQVDSPRQIAVCPTTESYRAEATIGPRGGSIAGGGHRLTIPAGTLARPTRFTLHAPAGDQVRLELTANGADHYRFSTPVVVTISYDRCTRQHWPPAQATAWYLADGETQPSERMRGKDDRKRRAVTFLTNHFSTYVVAY